LESKNNDFLQFLGRSISDLGGGVFCGGLFANSTVGEFARKNGIDLKKLEKFFEIKGGVEFGLAIAEHNIHRDEGKDYKSNCKLCNL
jgi:2-hydroxy-3-keto-5-methylthiopentenyl-1-phosphate phosphatase